MKLKSPCNVNKSQEPILEPRAEITVKGYFGFLYFGQMIGYDIRRDKKRLTCFTSEPLKNILRLYAVVGCFLGDIDIMRMRFTKSGSTNLSELAVNLEFLNGRSTAVTHT